jgi:hypothetical protein
METTKGNVSQTSKKHHAFLFILYLFSSTNGEQEGRTDSGEGEFGNDGKGGGEQRG